MKNKFKKNENIKNQQVLNSEQDIDEGVAESYYLENEAWGDISVSRGYGPARIYLDCSRCSAHYGAPSPITPCPVCGHYTYPPCKECKKTIAGSDGYCSKHSRSNASSSRSSSSSYTPSPTYYCANGCGSIVSYSGNYCYQHSNQCSSCSTRIPSGQSYCSSHQPSCRGCGISLSSSTSYCSATACQKVQQNQNTINSLQSQLNTERTARQTAEQQRDARPNITNAQWTQVQQAQVDLTDLETIGERLVNAFNEAERTRIQAETERDNLQTQLGTANQTIENARNHLGVVDLTNLPEMEMHGNTLQQAITKAQERDTIEGERDAAITERDNARTERDTARRNLTTVNNTITTAQTHLGVTNLGDDLTTHLNGQTLPEIIEEVRRLREQNNQPRNQELQNQIQELQEQLADFEILPLGERIRVQRRYLERLTNNARNRINNNLHNNNLERLLRAQIALARGDNQFAQEMLDDLRQEILNSTQLTKQEINRLLQARIKLTRLENQQQEQQEQQANIQVPPPGRNN
ncbi:hypothetical protein [endosymbiont GvMRE of Glomus versiforme]|uniref:hypothetical protein n=1 Tax=endosymbiont GvMRE of Glomus versiforme TaxID=2039283 RepID=UPI000ECF501F|nr:hypothetical protein [endosymbiont GvMRE of Glomus versiforme]RHZ37671.1 hypothetical protein GvMRE_I1g194 [endosymbiont GvMRE of Glomus versiforme]